MSLNVRIITPEKVFLTSETEQVVLPSITGGVGILKGHAPLVTILEAGVLRYKNNGTWTPAVLYGGFAEVEDDQVTVQGCTQHSDIMYKPLLQPHLTSEPFSLSFSEYHLFTDKGRLISIRFSTE